MFKKNKGKHTYHNLCQFLGVFQGSIHRDHNMHLMVPFWNFSYVL